MDRNFAVERALCEALLGPQGEKLMGSRIESCFPSNTQLCSMAETAQKLEALREGVISKCVGDKATAALKSAAEIVAGLEQGEPPKKQYMTSNIMATLSPKLELFCQHAEETGSKVGKKIFTGAKAAEAKLKVAQERWASANHTNAFTQDFHINECISFARVNFDLKQLVHSNLSQPNSAQPNPTPPSCVSGG